MPEEKAKPQIEFRYFSATEGHVVARYGTQLQIGASQGPDGWQVNPDLIVAIPMREVAQYTREYGDALRRGELKKRTKAEFEAQEAQLQELEGQEPSAPPAPEPEPEIPSSENDPAVSAEEDEKRAAAREKAKAGVDKLKQGAPAVFDAPPGNTREPGTFVQGERDEDDHA